MPAHLSSRIDYDPLINWLLCLVSQSEPLCLPALLFCSAICTHWKSKPVPPPSTTPSIVYCLVLFFALWPQLSEKERSVNDLGQEIQQFGKIKKKDGSLWQHCFVLLWPLAVSLEKPAIKQLLLKPWIYLQLVWVTTKTTTWTMPSAMSPDIHVLSLIYLSSIHGEFMGF